MAQISRNIFLSIMIILMITGCTNKKYQANEHFKKANEYYFKDDYVNALKQLSLAQNLDSTNFEFHILKAEIKTITNRQSEAIEILEMVLNKNYKADTVSYLIAGNYFELGSHYNVESLNSDQRDLSFRNAVRYYDNALSKIHYTMMHIVIKSVLYIIYIGMMKHYQV